MGLLRRPRFFVVTIITLALGVGATTAIYSVINGVLLRPLPYREPDKIVQLWQLGERGGRSQVSDPNYEDWKAGTRGFSAMAQIADAGVVSVSGGSEPVRVRLSAVSRDFLSVLGVRPERGRWLVAEEQRVGAPVPCWSATDSGNSDLAVDLV